jgi:hypothetical protein
VVGEFSVCLARIGLKVADDGLIDRIHGESMLDLTSGAQDSQPHAERFDVTSPPCLFAV